MTVQYTAIKVLIASPDDVSEERAIVEELIEEHNRNWGRARAFLFEPLAWDKDTIPGFGYDSQEVVNRALGDNYDVFFGVFWKRLGTPTLRARSGSEEEFDRAYDRYKTDPDSVQLMCYFADRPIIYSKEDPEQLALVADFRRKVASLGGLYDTYQDLDTFRNKVRAHLSKVARDYESRAQSMPNRQAARPPSLNAPTASLPDDDAAGFLDLLERGTESLITANAAITRVGSAIDRMGASVTSRTDDLKRAPSDRPAEIKRIVNRAADDLLTFVEETQKALPEFGPSFQSGMDDLGRAAVIAKEMNPGDTASVERTLTSVASLRDSIRSSRPGLNTLRTSIAGLPRLTTDLNKARSRTVQAMDDIDLQFSNAIETAEAVHALLKALIEPV